MSYTAPSVNDMERIADSLEADFDELSDALDAIDPTHPDWQELREQQAKTQRELNAVCSALDSAYNAWEDR